MEDEKISNKTETEIAQNIQPKLYRGWREIRDAMGLTCSSQTTRRIARQFRMPFFYLSGKPTITEGNLRHWLKVILDRADAALSTLEANLCDPKNVENLAFPEKITLYGILTENKFRSLNFLQKLNSSSQMKKLANIMFGSKEFKNES